MGLSEVPLFLDLEAFLATVKNQEGFGKGREDNWISGERNPAVLLSLKEKSGRRWRWDGSWELLEGVKRDIFSYRMRVML